MIRRPPRSTRTDTLFPDTTLFRSRLVCANDRYEALFGGLPTPPGLPVGDSDVSLLAAAGRAAWRDGRSEEHTSELQSLMRISYAVFCLKKKNNIQTEHYIVINL